MREKNVAEVGKGGWDRREERGSFHAASSRWGFPQEEHNPRLRVTAILIPSPQGVPDFHSPWWNISHPPPFVPSLPLLDSDLSSLCSLSLSLSLYLGLCLHRFSLSSRLRVFSHSLPPSVGRKAFRGVYGYGGRSGMNRTVCRLSRLSHRESNKSRPDGWGMNRTRLISAKERRFFSRSPLEKLGPTDLDLDTSIYFEKLGEFFFWTSFFKGKFSIAFQRRYFVRSREAMIVLSQLFEFFLDGRKFNIDVKFAGSMHCFDAFISYYFSRNRQFSLLNKRVFILARI